jgi:hypothetical protein
MNRSAPKAGYDFGNKRQYRRSVWKTFREHCNGRLDASQALLMPSAEGDEIDVALNNGFKDYNLHIVDRNAAIVAHLKRRHPRINTYGADVSAASARLVRSGVRLDVANLDLCSPLGDKLRQELIAFMRPKPMSADGGMIALTMLRGREYGEGLSCIRDAKTFTRVFKNTDGMRLFIAKMALIEGTEPDPWCASLVRSESYKSSAGNQTMLWAVFRVRPFDFQNTLDWTYKCASEIGRVCGLFGPAAYLLADPLWAAAANQWGGVDLMDVLTKSMESSR